jgi:hypothetical protein
MQMLTVGCSEGHDATAWHTTITRLSSHPVAQKPDYEAIECMFAPKQGRSGGGLFTSDGFLAGICNFAEANGDRGHYATPSSIHRILDRNNLAFVYWNTPSALGELADQIRVLEAQIEHENVKLLRLKELRRQVATHSLPSPGSADVEPIVLTGPTERTLDSPDHERRLRVVEQKLDRVLKLLEGAAREETPTR